MVKDMTIMKAGGINMDIKNTETMITGKVIIIRNMENMEINIGRVTMENTARNIMETITGKNTMGTSIMDGKANMDINMENMDITIKDTKRREVKMFTIKRNGIIRINTGMIITIINIMINGIIMMIGIKDIKENITKVENGM